ncbi:nucleotidyltransferase domain-containing protein [Pseudomonas alloputida]|uniref:nucleotidyltransferase domain-containing protein n=1 Tax=Pseudomonas TaxID=286 RepID=UPI003EEC20FD
MKYKEFLEQYPVINDHHNHSNDILEKLRNEIRDALDSNEHKDSLTVVTTGSYGRREASLESDIDLFIFFNSEEPDDALEEVKKTITEITKKYIKKDPGDTGTFGTDAIVRFHTMLTNIGGDKDSNQNFTRRMLFLLEGTWLYSEERFNAYRSKLLAKYLKTGNPENQISRFLFNDIIRYYRTITTDFEYKVTESQKSWGLRNIKLRFSRKILYFGGVVSVAETALKTNEEKTAELSKLFDIPVLERISKVGELNPHTKHIFTIYEYFLEAINCTEKRQILEQVTRDKREESPEYLELRSKSKQFSDVLAEWIKHQYPATGEKTHPIHNALLF